MRVGLITLGCDKNTVDNEYLAGLLEGRGCEVSFLELEHDGAGLDAVVVTTCGFIENAKQQSVEAIVHVAQAKAEPGGPRRLYVAGCLAQRYADDLLKEVPEIDGLVGVGQYEELTRMIATRSAAHAGSVHTQPSVHIEQFMRRRRSDAKPHAFLKISDGCNHGCTFCSIPLMKGRRVSVPRDILLEEARQLLGQGVRELILVAQDLADYGREWGKDYRLPELLRDLARIEGDFWIRCMYCYPAGVTDAFLEVMASEPKIVPYLDVPLQHLDPIVMRRMKRPYLDVSTKHLIERLRARVPHIALRTTMIVGFPGETGAAHRRMLAGMHALRFNWLGAFQYSPEEGTPAEAMTDPVDPDTKAARWRAVMEAQAAITRDWNASRVGTRTRVLVEERDAATGQWVGRSPAEAPEVDGSVYLDTERDLAAGEFVEAEIVHAQDYDVIARVY